MKFGAQVNCYLTTWDNIRTVIEAMEAGRWDSLWFADHYMPSSPKREEELLPAYEGYTLIAAAASITERMRLGNLVLDNTYRNPALLAKTVTTLDIVSGGRAECAVGYCSSLDVGRRTGEERWRGRRLASGGLAEGVGDAEAG